MNQKNYAIDFTYKIIEGGTVTLPAIDIDDADQKAREYIAETYEGVDDVFIETIRELDV